MKDFSTTLRRFFDKVLGRRTQTDTITPIAPTNKKAGPKQIKPLPAKSQKAQKNDKVPAAGQVTSVGPPGNQKTSLKENKSVAQPQMTRIQTAVPQQPPPTGVGSRVDDGLTSSTRLPLQEQEEKTLVGVETLADGVSPPTKDSTSVKAEIMASNSSSSTPVVTMTETVISSSAASATVSTTRAETEHMTTSIEIEESTSQQIAPHSSDLLLEDVATVFNHGDIKQTAAIAANHIHQETTTVNLEGILEEASTVFNRDGQPQTITVLASSEGQTPDNQVQQHVREVLSQGNEAPIEEIGTLFNRDSTEADTVPRTQSIVSSTQESTSPPETIVIEEVATVFSHGSSDVGIPTSSGIIVVPENGSINEAESTEIVTEEKSTIFNRDGQPKTIEKLAVTSVSHLHDSDMQQHIATVLIQGENAPLEEVGTVFNFDRETPSHQTQLIKNHTNPIQPLTSTQPAYKSVESAAPTASVSTFSTVSQESVENVAVASAPIKRENFIQATNTKEQITMTDRFHVRKVAVLGAGVMGAQIAAHLVSAGVPAVLYELPAKEGDPNADVVKAVQNLRKMQPAPAGSPDKIDYIAPANYATGMELLRDCNLVIEVIAERPDWKHDLYNKVLPYLPPDAILSTNTSGLSIDMLCSKLPGDVQKRFCGVHFFNPPRYMPLVELIPGTKTDPSILDSLESFIVSTLGKSVVRAKDTPNFVGNRIGVFSIIATMYHAARLGIPFDVVDSLTGKNLGRPNSATFRTADLVGLDTMAHVISGSYQVLPNDPWREYYRIPAWLQGLIDKGALGQKTKGGIYRKDGKIMVLDPDNGEYRPSKGDVAPEVAELNKIRDSAKRFAAWRNSEHPQAQFLWASQRDLFHYAAVLSEEISNSARDIDMAMRWGYGWKQGPFEIWQGAGWKQLAEWIEADIATGKTMSKVALPAWVKQINDVHTPEGSWSAGDKAYRPRSGLPVYKRQHFPEQVLGEAAPSKGTTIYQNAGARLWTLDNEKDVAILTILSKMHAIGDEVLDGILGAIDIAEKQFAGLVIWDQKGPFSVGANLAQIAPVVMAGNFNNIGQVVEKFQYTTSRLRYCQVPTVAAVQGLALGGGCETLMHCDRVVAALESYIGLVEAGVGVIPAGGGCKEFALRASQRAIDGKVFASLKDYYMNIAMAKVATSGQEAQQLGFLRSSDIVVFNVNELLYVAINQAKAMADAGYRPPLRPKIKVAGRTGVANIKSQLVNMRDGGFISEHDFLVASKTAEIICGGDIDPGVEVDESYILKLEKEVFVELLHTKKTMERITYMLQNNKPLRN